MAMMRPWGRMCGVFAVAVSCALGCSKSTPSTQTGLMIIVSTNMGPSEYDVIRVEVSQELGAGSGNWDKLEDDPKSVPAEVVLPATVFVRSGQAADQDALVQVTAYLMGQPVVLREAQLQIPTDRVAELRLVLAESCKGQVRVVGDGGAPVSTCPMGQSCQPETGSCGDRVIPPGTVLSTYVPGDEKIDAGLAITGAGGSGPEGSSSSGSSSSGSSGSSGNSSSGSSSSGSSSNSGRSDGGGVDGSRPDASSSGSSSSSGGATCTNVCTAGLTQCASPGVETCERQANGCTQWVATATCGPHQTCSATAGVASCRCDATVCTQAGTVCQDAQTVATCATDANACLYAASTKTCTAPESCVGASPAAACSLICLSMCTQGQTTCVPAGIETCTLGVNGCWGYGTAAPCGAHQACTGIAGSSACTCNTDPVCSAVGSVCANASTLASCARDAQGCVYESASSVCTSGACNAGTNACTSGVSACAPACGTGLVCERLGGASCVDPNWAEWPIVDSPSYTDNGDGTVTDNGTGLVWQQAVPATTYTQTAALAYCAGLSLGGYTDWRLPSYVELQSIVDFSAYDPSINAAVFPGTPASDFWTSTPYAGASGFAWYVDFNSGYAYYYVVSYSLYVRCVR